MTVKTTARSALSSSAWLKVGLCGLETITTKRARRSGRGNSHHGADHCADGAASLAPPPAQDLAIMMRAQGTPIAAVRNLSQEGVDSHTPRVETKPHAQRFEHALFAAPKQGEKLPAVGQRGLRQEFLLGGGEVIRGEGLAIAQTARPPRWLIEITTGAGSLPRTTSGAPPGAARISIRARERGSAGRLRWTATRRFAVQRPSRQSARRLGNRMPCWRMASLTLSQSSPAGKSAEVCSSQ